MLAEPTDHTHAATIADRAGRLLLKLREALDGDAPADADRVRADGDRGAHELIMEELAAVRPADPVLSEEGKLEPARLDSRRVWIVDPLDGTREFGEPGRTDWAVHVALTVDGAPAAGAVALPACGMTLATEPAPLLPVPSGRRPRLVVSRSRAPELCFEVAKRIDAEVVLMGSAGAKTMAVVLGVVDVYLHAGGQYEWDSAAPVAVAAACGLHTSRIDGSRLRYNNRDPWLPDLLVCRPELADEVLAAVADLGGS